MLSLLNADLDLFDIIMNFLDYEHYRIFIQEKYLFLKLRKGTVQCLINFNIWILLQETRKIFEFQKSSNLFKGSQSTRLLCIWIFVGKRNGLFCYSIFKIYDFTRYATS